MKNELKKVIINFILDNQTEFQLYTATKQRFREYIYNSKGEYLIGGDDVSTFIDEAIILITKYK